MKQKSEKVVITYNNAQIDLTRLNDAEVFSESIKILKCFVVSNKQPLKGTGENGQFQEIYKKINTEGLKDQNKEGKSKGRNSANQWNSRAKKGAFGVLHKKGEESGCEAVGHHRVCFSGNREDRIYQLTDEMLDLITFLPSPIENRTSKKLDKSNKKRKKLSRISSGIQDKESPRKKRTKTEDSHIPDSDRHRRDESVPLPTITEALESLESREPMVQKHSLTKHQPERNVKVKKPNVYINVKVKNKNLSRTNEFANTQTSLGTKNKAPKYDGKGVMLYKSRRDFILFEMLSRGQHMYIKGIPGASGDCAKYFHDGKFYFATPYLLSPLMGMNIIRSTKMKYHPDKGGSNTDYGRVTSSLDFLVNENIIEDDRLWEKYLSITYDFVTFLIDNEKCIKELVKLTKCQQRRRNKRT